MNGPARGRVLVVDDEVFIVQLLERMLGREHDVTATTSPIEALQWVREGRRFDVILADVMMPGLNGLELHHAIADVDDTQAARIVFVTGGTFTTTLERELESTNCLVLRKPVGMQVIRTVVRERVG
jgi:CheY-like chemotaxis protein